MAIDYAVKYSGQVEERFTAESKSDLVVNQDYDFTGAKTVKAYNVSTSEMNDYSRSGSSRYGTANELDATTEEMTMTQDKSFTFTIDKMNNDETMGALEAGKALARQLREVAIPLVDTYRYGKIAENAGNTSTKAITKENVYDEITSATEALDEKKIPVVGRELIVTPKTYKFMKQSKDIILETEIGQEMRIKGVVAVYDGMNVIKLPSSYLPEGANFIITHKLACIAPVKLAEYKVHDDPPGISGKLVEGRLYYDAFVLNNRKNAIFYHSTKAVEPAKA
ncbi:MAG: hypothetical protein GXZ08_02420 [Tissierellia bacterium]|nr:hypothetical protein [Tissierellia bacterium]